MFDLPHKSVFYSIERAIKQYRRFAQKEISAFFDDLTLDQALVLIFIANNPEMNQAELGELVFKDSASVTRIIELLCKNNYLQRQMHDSDRRRFKLILTKKGKEGLSKIVEIIRKNRETALEDIPESDLSQLKITLHQIVDNCTK